MSPRLHDLERRWRETGEAADEAAWLAARLEDGDLARDRLELAAHLGHGPARRALGAAAPSGVDDLAAWVRRLEGWGKEASVRAGIAAARFALPEWERRNLGDDRPEEALTAAEEWVRCPCEEHRQAAADVAERLASGADDSGEGAVVGASAVTFDAGLGAQAALDMAIEAAHAAGETSEPGELETSVDAVEVVTSARRKVEAGAEGTVRAAIRDALTPWALGTGDPLAGSP